jgi:hypothetical protein
VSVERYMHNHTDKYDGVIVILVRVRRICKGSHGLDNRGAGLKDVVKWAREANQNNLYLNGLSLTFRGLRWHTY